MTTTPLIGASELSTAKLLDMKLGEFRALVAAGVLPKGREIAPGVIRWPVDDIKRIVKGDAVDGMGDVQW